MGTESPKYVDRILLVDPTGDDQVVDADTPVGRHATRPGRGGAILAGAERAFGQGMTHIVTLDVPAGGESADFSRFVTAIHGNPDSIIVGKRDFAVPGWSRRAGLKRLFSSVLLRIQTGRIVADVASGSRAYPVCVLRGLKFWTHGSSFEKEVLVRAAWAGIELRDIDLSPGSTVAGRGDAAVRVLWGHLLLVLLNVHLTLRSVVPWPHRRLLPDASSRERITILHPLRSLRRLILENTSPQKIALAVALGVLLGTLPLFFVHTVAIILLANLFRLNKPAAIVASQLCMPPIVPALCIELGHRLRHGYFLTEISLRTLGYQAWDRVLEWILGSLVLAPVLAVVTGLAAYAMALAVNRQLKSESRIDAQ